MIKKSLIATAIVSTIAVIYLIVYSFYLIHQDLVTQRDKELLEQKMKNDLLILHTKELYEKINAYDTVLKEILENGCHPPSMPDGDGKKKEQQL